MTDTTTPAQIEQKIEAIIKTVDSTMTPHQQAVMGLMGTVVVSLANAALPLIPNQNAVHAFEDGLGQALDGIEGLSIGVQAMMAATQHKPTPEQQAQAA